MCINLLQILKTSKPRREVPWMWEKVKASFCYVARLCAPEVSRDALYCVALNNIISLFSYIFHWCMISGNANVWFYTLWTWMCVDACSHCWNQKVVSSKGHRYDYSDTHGLAAYSYPSVRAQNRGGNSTSRNWTEVIRLQTEVMQRETSISIRGRNNYCDIWDVWN